MVGQVRRDGGVDVSTNFGDDWSLRFESATPELLNALRNHVGENVRISTPEGISSDHDGAPLEVSGVIVGWSLDELPLFGSINGAHPSRVSVVLDSGRAYRLMKGMKIVATQTGIRREFSIWPK